MSKPEEKRLFTELKENDVPMNIQTELDKLTVPKSKVSNFLLLLHNFILNLIKINRIYSHYLRTINWKNATV